MPSTRTRDALALQAAQDRPRRGGAEARRADAGQVGEGVAEARLQVVSQFFLVEDRDAAKHVAGRAPHAGDDDRLVLVGMGRLGVARSRRFHGAASRRHRRQ